MEDKLADLGHAFWQFEIGGVPLPRIEAQGKMGRREGEWWLKVWGERLLFCAADAPRRVFAVATPCEGASDVVSFWRAAVERGDFGEVSAVSRQLKNPIGWANFVILKANSGRSWARDCGGGDWIEFVGPKFPESFVRNSLANSEYDAVFKLWHRVLPESEREQQSLLWLRGSCDEWQHVLQSCATLQYQKKPTDNLGCKIEPGEHFYSFYSHCPFGQGIMDGADEEDYDVGVWAVSSSWKPIFMRQFVPVGWEWYCTHRNEKHKRCSWRIRSESPSVPIYLSLHPTHHEQLEAHLFLRDWLRGKVPDDQIESLLN